MTLTKLRGGPGLECTLTAIYYLLVDMGLTYRNGASRS